MPYKDDNIRKIKTREAVRRQRAKNAEIIIPPAKFKSEKLKAENNLLYFMRTFLPHLFPLKFSAAHIDVINQISETIKKGGCFCFCLPRGFGKTTIVQAALLHSLLYGKRRLIVLVNANIGEAKEAISDIRDLLEDPDSKLAQAFPEAFYPFYALDGSPRRAQSQTINGKKTKILMAVDKLVFPMIEGSKCSGSMIIAKSAQSNLRGMKRKGMRPDCVVIDDAEDSESAWSDSSQKRLRRLYDSEIQGLRGPRSKLAVFNLATIQRKGCIADIYSNPEVKRNWNGKRYSFVQTFSSHPELWEQYETLRQKDHAEANAFYKDIKNRALMDEGTSVLWPENFADDCLSAYQEAINWKVDNGLSSFDSELMNDPKAETVEQTEQLSTHDVTSKSTTIPKGIVPADAEAVTVAVDISKYLLHYSVVSFNSSLSGHVVDYGTYDVPDLPDTAKAITKALNGLNDEIIKPGWMGLDGITKYNASMTLIDSGYFPECAYQFCRINGFLRNKPTKGHGTGTEKTGQSRLRYFIPKDLKGGIIAGNQWYIGQVAHSILVHFNADHWKEDLITRWKKEVTDEGTLTIYKAERGWKDLIRLASHQCAERLIEEVKNGRLTRVFKRESKANHWMDTMALDLLAASILGIGNQSIEQQAEHKSAETTPANPPPAPKPRHKSPKMTRRIGKVRRIGNSSPYPFGPDPICF